MGVHLHIWHTCAVYGKPTQAAATDQARAWQSRPCTGLSYATPSPCKSLMTGCCFGQLRETWGRWWGEGGESVNEGSSSSSGLIRVTYLAGMCAALLCKLRHVTCPMVGVPSTIATMCTSGSGRTLLHHGMSAPRPESSVATRTLITMASLVLCVTPLLSVASVPSVPAVPVVPAVPSVLWGGGSWRVPRSCSASLCSKA